MQARRPTHMAIAAAALALIASCAWLRPTLGLCQRQVSQEMQDAKAAADEYTRASFVRGLAQYQLSLFEPAYEEVAGSEERDIEETEYAFRYSELNPPSLEQLPVFGRDAQGLAHLIERRPRVIQERSIELCECVEGYNKGIAPAEIVRIYKTGPLGPPVTIEYDVKVFKFRRNACPRKGPPRV